MRQYSETRARYAMHMVAVAMVVFTAGSGTSQKKLKVPDDAYAAMRALPIQKSPDNGIAIRVLDADKKPMAGVSLLVVDAEKLRAVEGRLLTIQEELARKHPGLIERTLVMISFYSSRYVTDENGESTIPPDKRQTRVLAVHGKTAVHEEIEADCSSVEIRFPIPDPVHVLVVDPGGKPVADVPVGLSQGAGRRMSALHGAGAVTDRSGRAAVHRRALMLSDRGASTKIRVVARVLSEKVVGVVVDPHSFRNTKEKPLRLVLPECGSVEVLFLDSNNRPQNAVDHVRLSLAGRSGFFGFGRQRSLSRKAEAGKATFRFVETGLKLVATCTLAGKSWPRRREFHGPRKAGDTRRVRINNVNVSRSIDVRLIGLDGKPVVSERVGVIFLRPNQHDREELRTNSRGKLRILVPNRLGDSGDVELRIQRVRMPKQLFGRPYRAPAEAYLGAYRAPLEEALKLAAGSDLKLQTPALVLGGRIVDEQGSPVAGVVLSIPENHPGVRSGGGSGSDVYFKPRLTTDAEGRFAFREIAEPRKRVEVQIQSDTHTALKKLRFAGGTENATIRLTRTFAIHGKVLGVPGRQYLHITASAERQSEEHHTGARSIYARFQPGGSFTIPGCLPGTYRIVFHRGDDRRVFHTIQDVRVVKGSDCRDHRLLALDFTRFLRWVTIKVVDGRGRPVRGCTVSRIFESKHGRSSSGFRTDRNGTVTVMVFAEGGLFEVNQSGYRLQRFEKVRRDLLVKLSSSYKARVTVSNLPALKLARLEVQLKNNYKRQTLRRAADTAEFDVRSAGRHVITLTAMPQGSGESRMQRRIRISRNGGEKLQIRTVEFEVNDKTATEGAISVKIELSAAQAEFLRNYEALLQERDTGR